MELKTAQLRTTAAWGLRAFPLRRGDEVGLWSVIVPEVCDVSGVRRGNHERLEVVGAVRLARDGELLDSGRSEVTIAVVHVGDAVPIWNGLSAGPRLLGQVPAMTTGWAPANPEEERPAWAYFVGSTKLLGGGDLYADKFEVVPS